MRAIGFRASTTGVVFAVVEGEAGSAAATFDVLTMDTVPVPAALWPPNQLHFVRTVLLDVMQEYGVERAGLRLTETMARRNYPFRNNIEGVIQELLASSTVSWYIAGMNATLTAKLGLADKTLFKKFCDGEATPDFVSHWSDIHAGHREAVLAAVASLRGKPVMAPMPPIAAEPHDTVILLPGAET
jgi:hypothetical protein